MTIGVGGKKRQEVLNSLSDMTDGVPAIQVEEFQQRIERLQEKMLAEGVAATYLHAGTNLYYFTGLKWSPSERMVGAVVPAVGEISYIAPQFELDTLRDYWQIPAEIQAWEEHENPYVLLCRIFGSMGASGKKVLLDEATPYFVVTGIQAANSKLEIGNAQPLTQSLRSRKTENEINLIRRAHEMTLRVQAAAASILAPGISSVEVAEFIDQAHRKVGAAKGSYFCIVLFDVGTSFPHGVKGAQTLKKDDWVLIDTGFQLDGYHSDITRSYCFGEPTEAHRKAWSVEKSAQIAAFDAAKVGAACEVCDNAARHSLETAGYGPDYKLPGLPHRTGHGCGLDIHEGPNLVRGEKTSLDVGMVFSSEPMLVIPDQFGVRLEDHFYMTENGPKWFTEPSHSVDDPFGA
jgi:Xaa-Pro dipeptidase